MNTNNTNSNRYSSVEEVPVWGKAHSLTLDIYRITEGFPKSEMFGLISQLRRSTSSIPANISEGFYRNSTKELVQFLFTARGSLGESKYHLRLARDLNYVNNEQFLMLSSQCEEIGKQLNGWIKSLKGKVK